MADFLLKIVVFLYYCLLLVGGIALVIMAPFVIFGCIYSSITGKTLPWMKGNGTIAIEKRKEIRKTGTKTTPRPGFSVFFR